jgi:hypothetical protein
MSSPDPASIPQKLALSNLQLQLLKLYAEGVSDHDLKAIRRMIARYFADKASADAQVVWTEKGYDAAQFLKENMRTPYKSAQK